MNAYDDVAETYDRHYSRPVDRWEDARLARQLGRWVNNRRVLDLGCGTGWVLDNLKPADYVGLDASPAMLHVLGTKHPDARTTKVEIGSPGWDGALAWEAPFDAVVSTWAAHYLGDLADLLGTLAPVVLRHGVIALHGDTVRRQKRNHYIAGDHFNGGDAWDPDHFDAVEVRGLRYLGCHGTGAVADPSNSPLGRLAWNLGNALAPPGRHYGLMAAWRVL